MADTSKAAPKLLPPKQESAGMSLLSNTLAIVGFIILVIIVVWGLLHLVSLSRSSFSSFFSSPPKITVNAPANALSGQSITIAWTNSETNSGSYALLYQCVNNFQFATAGENGATNRIPCGSAINVGSSTSATMIPTLVGTSTISVPVSVVFTPSDGSMHLEGSAVITVAASNQIQTPVMLPPATKTPAPKPAKPVATYTRHYAPATNVNPVAHAASGPADLSVNILAVGIIDPSSGALLVNQSPQPGDIVGVEFDIANIGGSATGSWYFQAHLPTAQSYTYTSPAQMSLTPGAHIVNTLRFTQAVSGGIFTVIADPNSQINDANRANNEAAVTIY